MILPTQQINIMMENVNLRRYIHDTTRANLEAN